MRLRVSILVAATLCCRSFLACSDEPRDDSGDGGVQKDAPATFDVAGPSGCYAVPQTPPGVSAHRDPDLLAKAAAVAGSCIEDDGIERMLASMWTSDVMNGLWYQRLALQAECLANARCGCTAVSACLGFELRRSDAGACSPCSGSVLSQCSPGIEGKVDCALLGLSCDPAAGCSDPSALPCTPSSFVPSCDAKETPQLCLQKGPKPSVTRGADCPKLGLACAGGRCIGKGDACSGGASSPEGAVFFEGISCNGANLEACVENRKTTLNCAERGPGFSCQTFGGQSFCGLASECTPALRGLVPQAASCEGNNVVFCNAGRIERIDCTTLGFTGCDVDKSKHTYGCTPGPTLE